MHYINILIDESHETIIHIDTVYEIKVKDSWICMMCIVSC